MPTRRPEIRSSADAVELLAKRLRTLEDTVSERALPPGYVYSIDSNLDLVITRISDGATATVIFS